MKFDVIKKVAFHEDMSYETKALAKKEINMLEFIEGTDLLKAIAYPIAYKPSVVRLFYAHLTGKVGRVGEGLGKLVIRKKVFIFSPGRINHFLRRHAKEFQP